MRKIILFTYPYCSDVLFKITSYYVVWSYIKAECTFYSLRKNGNPLSSFHVPSYTFPGLIWFESNKIK